jgi:alcohol dehydrogenase class IV
MGLGSVQYTARQNKMQCSESVPLVETEADMTSQYSFSAPTEIVGGLGALEGLPSLVERFNPERVAVVADEGIVKAGLLDGVLAELAPWQTAVFGSVCPDPTTTEVEVIAREAIEQQCDMVVAVGGGSGLAAGKAVALRLRNGEPIETYAGRDQAPGGAAPSIAIPTTAGSGSEVSNALVLHDPARPVVLVVRGRGYEPDIALLDGLLLRSLPRAPMIYAGLDALSHAIEALSVRKRSPFTDAMAYAAADIIYEVLPRAIERRDPDDLQTLLEASAAANLACGSSELGLVHALSLSAAVHLPHGYQNAVMMPYVSLYNRDHVPARVAGLFDRILPLYRELDFDPHFQPGELDAEAAESMVRVALAVPLSANNVRTPTEVDVRELLIEAGAPLSSSNVRA